MTAVVELNGKKYDAVTGRLLGESDTPKPQRVASSTKGTAMDFVRSTTNTVRRSPTSVATAKEREAATTAARPTVTRTSPKHLAAHQPQHAKTLMRHAVQRPAASFKKQAKAASYTGALVKQPELTVIPKQAAVSMDESRLHRARHINRSKLVRHFDTSNYVRPRSSSTAAPSSTAVPHRTPQPTYPTQGPAMSTTKPPSADIFERALAQANSHKQPYHPVNRKTKKSHRGRTALSIAASSLAILLIVGFIAYQNATSIQLRLAASRSGINASLPRWRPSGFAVGKFVYAPGTVTVSFNDQQTNGSFTITQAASNWDSSALLNEYVLAHASNSYNTIESAGTTIYTYGDNNATWVNNNIWYRLDTNGNLSTSQIVQLATSM